MHAKRQRFAAQRLDAAASSRCGAARQLAAACPLYIKDHSYGEYVFDWAWANAYEQHGLAYYPKAVVAVPFTPVPGARLLARDAASRALLVQALVAWCKEEELSSLHLLFGADEDIAACAEAGLMLRHTVQFHWTEQPDWHRLRRLPRQPLARQAQEDPAGAPQGADAGVSFRWSRGADISAADWDFFYRCYARTYREHGNPPYLTPRLLPAHGRDACPRPGCSSSPSAAASRSPAA